MRVRVHPSSIPEVFERIVLNHGVVELFNYSLSCSCARIIRAHMRERKGTLISGTYLRPRLFITLEGVLGV